MCANHVALEVGNIEEAFQLYCNFFDVEITRQSKIAAFIHSGDQFINFTQGRTQGSDNARYFGIEVSHKELARETLVAMSVELIDSRCLVFLNL